MNKEHLEKILNRTIEDGELSEEARRALEIMRKGDYMLQSSGNGIPIAEYIKILPHKRHLPGLEGKNGNVTGHLVIAPKYYINITLDSQDEPVEISISEARPINLMTGAEIEPDSEENS